MDIIHIIDRKTGSKISITEQNFNLNGSKIVMLDVSREDIKSLERQGNQLIITMKSGTVIIVNDFFVAHGGNESKLVINDQEVDGAGYWWVEDPATGSNWSQLDNLDPLMIEGDSASGIAPWMYWAAGGAGLAGIGAAVANDQDNNHNHTTPPAVSKNPSDPVVISNNGEGIVGKADPGTIVILTKPDGATEVAVVDENGNWSFKPNPLNNGDEGKFVSENQSSGNSSNEVTSIADTQAPDAPIIDTNNASGITGTAEANSTVTLTKPDGNTETTIADDQGNWSFAPNPLTDGQEGKFTATDEAGNTGDEATSIAHIDGPADPVVDTNNGTELSGTSDPDTTITLTKPDGSTETTTSDDQGNWSFLPNPLDHGEEGTVKATDGSGNDSTDVDTGIADKEAPDAPIIDTNNASGITGTAEANSTVTLTKPDGNTETTIADDQGNWSFAPNPLTDGQEGKFTATDEAGNTGDEATSIAHIDGPADPVVDTNNGTELSGTSDPDTTITLTKPDGSTETTTSDDQGNWSFLPNPLDHGEEGTVKATDGSGNDSTDVDTGIADKEAPDAPIIDTNNASGITGTAEANSTVTLTKPDGNTETTIADDQGNWSFAPNPLTDGQEGKFTATDEAGNTGDEATSIAHIDGPADPVVDTNNGTELSGTSDPDTTITLTKPDGSTETTTSDDQGNWSFLPNPLDHGEEGTVKATDGSGNDSTDVDTGIADKEAPDAPIIDTNNASGITGTAEANSTVTLTKPDGNTETTIADDQGNWSFAPNPLTDGQEGKFTATDEAGNTGDEATSIAHIDGPADPVVDTNNGTELSGTSDPDTTITLTKPDGSTETTTSDDQGNWSFLPNPLDHGEEGTVKATDGSGNDSTDVDTGIADKEAPDAPIIDTNNASGITGTAEANSTVTLTKPDGNTETTIADDQGNWSFAPNPLTDGQEGKFTATDEAGNTGDEATSIAHIDGPADPVVDTNNGTELSGTSDPDTTITLTKPDGSTETTTSDDQGNWSFLPNPLDHGEEGTVKATDGSGNDSTDVDTGIADKEAPDAPIIDTNNASGITGTAEANSTVTLTKPDGNTETTIADDQGNWSFAPNPLTDGQEGKFTATDEAGNTGDEATSIAHIDGPADPVVDTNNGTELSGTSDPDTTITLTKPDGSTETTTSDDQGNWSFLPNPLDHGEEGTVKATDGSGNDSTDVDTGIADKEAPDAPIIDTNNASGITGTAEANSTVTLTKPDGNTETTIADDQGNWSFAPNPLTDGQEGKFTATDEAGNTGDEATSIAHIDGPADPVVDTNNGTELSGTSDPDTTITLTKPDGSTETTTSDDQGNWSFLPNPLDHGEEGTVKATDGSGNDSTDVDTGIADKEAPDAPIIDTNNASGITGTAEANSTVTLTKPDGNTETTIADDQGNWSFAPNPLTDGQEGKFTATDEAGNTGDEATSIAHIDGPADPVVDTNNGTELSGTSDPDTTITLTKPDGSTETTTSDDQGNWSFLPNPLDHGEEGTVKATDGSGNDSTDVDTGIADKEAPDAPIIDTNNASGITGTAEANSTVTLTKPDGNTETTIADDQGNWSFAPNPLTDGQEGKFTATDEAGNTGDEATSIAHIDGPADPVVDTNNGTELSGTSDPDTTITLTKPDGSTETTTSDDQGNWSFLPNPLDHGEEGTVKATDGSGNDSTDVDTGIADKEAPDAPIIDTNNASGITGTAEANSTVTLTKPDGNTETTIADDQGNWSFAPNPLTDGQEGKFTATDEAGNTGDEATSIAHIDGPADPVVDTNNGTELSGTSDPDTTITLTKPDGSTETTTSDDQGNWSFLPNPLDHGEEGTVKATDGSGNDSTDVDTGIADKEAPDAPIIDTNNASGITGTAEANSTVTLTKPDGNTETTIADDQGNWSFAPNPLTDGQEGKFTATDEAGNTGDEATSIAHIDGPADPVVDTNNGTELSGTSDPDTTITLTKPDGSTETTTSDDQGNWSFLPNPLDHGEEGTVKATDGSGNDSTDVDTGIADKEAPDAPIIDTNNASGITGTAEANSTVTLTKPDGNTETTIADDQGNWSFAPNPLTDGQEGKFTATDEAGNTGDEATSIAHIDGPADPVVDTNNGTELSGTSDPDTTITLTKPDGSTETTTSDDQGNWSFLPNPLDHGEEGTVKATDGSGNDSTDVDTGIADKEAPDAPIIDTNNASGITGTAEANSTVTLTKPDGNTETTIADDQGNWSFAPNPLTDGQEGKFTATDEAGNTGDEATSIADTEAPDAPIIDTNNASGITGTAEANSTVTLTKPDGNTETTIADDQGNWSFAPNPLTDGQEGKFTATDEAGNTGDEATSIAHIDGPADPVVDTNNGTELSGTSDPDTTITLTKPDGSTETTTSDDQGNWSFLPNPLDHGEEGTVKATDGSGNDSTDVDTGIADKEAPDAPIIDTNNASGITGTAEANSTVTLTKPDGNTETTIADDQGNWSFAPNPLTDGQEGKFTATDEAGNTGDEATSIADTEAPDAPIVDTNNASGITGTAEANSTVTLTKPDGNTETTIADDQGNWSFAPNPLTDGQEGKFTATDEAGNTGDEATSIADTEAPDAPIIDTNNASGITGTAEANSTVTLTKPDGSTETTIADDQGNWSFAPNPLGHGEEGKFTATDEAGNTGDEATSIADTEAPDAPIVDTNNASGITGTAEANSTVTLTKPDGNTETTIADDQGNWSFAPNPLGHGEEGKFTATDEAGNTGDEATSTVDSQAPDAPVIINIMDDQAPVTGEVVNQGYTNDKTPTINGTAEIGSTVTIYNGGDVLGTVVTNDLGEWSFTPASELSDGTYNFTAVAKDQAGNISSESNDYTVILDTSVPNTNTITIDSITDDTGISDHDFITNDTTLIFKGSLGQALQANEQVVISLDGGSTWHVVDVNGTQWSYDNTANNMEGFYDIEVRVTTKSGNYNGTNAEQLIDVDTTAPDVDGLTTTFTISTDTSHGLVAGNDYSNSEEGTNTDLITRDQTITIKGALSEALGSGNYLQISGDNGLTWSLVSVNGTDWSYALPEFTASAEITYQLRVIDIAGNVATNDNFENGYTVVVDLNSPNGITMAPEVPVDANTADIYNYSSDVYGKVEAGTWVSLVNDVNGNGTYQEGKDTVIGFTQADADGNWSLDVKLPVGSSNLSFVVWDDAGNHSSMSTSNTVSTKDGDGFLVVEQDWGGTYDGYQAANTNPRGNYGVNTAAVTLNSKGQLTFFQPPSTGTNNGALYIMDDATNNSIASYNKVDLATVPGVTAADWGGYVTNVTFMDINRDGLQDVMTQKSAWGGGNSPVWMQNANGTYTGVNQRTTGVGTDPSHLGGVVAFDMNGNGYLDVMIADSEPNSTTFLTNQDGSLGVRVNIRDLLPSMKTGTFSLLHELSGVDLDNNGTIDIAGHTNLNAAGTLYASNLYTNAMGILYNDGEKFSKVIDFNNIFKKDGGIDQGDLIRSMTWADFNGDGYMDLLIGGGSKGGEDSDETRIYLNDGNGNLLASDDKALWFGDNLDSATTLAVDWDHDGKMDIIEVSRTRVTSQAPTLYMNTGDNVWDSASQKLEIGPAGEYTGAVTIDYDWDGAVDLILYRPGNEGSNGAGAVLVKNTNAVADGTSLHLRIVDGEGINCFYGNNINLYDSKGNLVATQILNPQSSGSSNSTAIVNFYGLDANETYSVQMLRIKNGVASHVGDGNNYGGYSEATINSAWGGLVAGKAHDAYVLTAEANGESYTTIGDGITGTGYNDTFVATAGNKTYNGGGGWDHNPSGKDTWSADGGLDVLDYSSVTSGMTIDLASGTATSTDGTYKHKLVSIEGIIGTSQADTIVSSGKANTVFEGGAGDDTFNLTAGAHDTLIYRILDGAAADGGNGHDSVEGFHLGNVKTDKDADIIDLGDLLDYKGTVSFYMDDGVKKLDYNSKAILDYIKAEVNESGDTVISIDRDGQGGGHGFTELVTLKGTDADLLSLLSNHQIVV